MKTILNHKQIQIKFAFLSHILPPSPSGQAVVIYRLLKSISPENYCLISREDYQEKQKLEASIKLNAKYYHLSAFTRKPFFVPILFYKVFKNLLLLYQRTKQISSILKFEKSQVLVTCTGDLIDLLSSIILSYKKKIPLILYTFDDIANQKNLPKIFMRKIQEVLIQRSQIVIVPNEFLQKSYQSLYQKEITLIHNPAPDLSIKNITKKIYLNKKRGIKIIYSGAIYEAHFDAFRNLARALGLIKKYQVKLYIYSSQHASVLTKNQIPIANIVFQNHISQQKIMAIQKKSDLLFLPLAFNPPYPEIIRTSAPGKMGEYLQSGKPILVHAPKDSFISWYFKKFKCGIVVDQNNPVALSTAIEKLIADVDLRKAITENALIQAKRDFSIKASSKKFINVINSINHGD